MDKNKEMYETVMANISYIQKQEEEREKKSNRRFLTICNVVGGANLAAGNIPGWLICTGVGFIPMLRNWIK